MIKKLFTIYYTKIIFVLLYKMNIGYGDYIRRKYSILIFKNRIIKNYNLYNILEISFAK